jgi:exopolysaccharide biosynthesis polyprenyl glycosylphosphotransferase
VIRPALVLADVVGLGLAFAFAQTTVRQSGPSGEWLKWHVFAASLPAWLLAAGLFKLYDSDSSRVDHSTVDDLVRVSLLVTVGSFLFTRISPLVSSNEPNAAKVTVFWASAIVLVAASRMAARTVVRRSARYLENTLIVGAGDVGQRLATKLRQHPEYRLNLVGVVDDDPPESARAAGACPIVGSVDQLPELVHELDVGRVIVAFSRDTALRTLDLVRQLGDENVCVEIVPRLFEAVGPNARMDWLESVPLLRLPGTTPSRSARKAKRAIDVTGAALVLVLTAPLFAFIAWKIRRDSAGPVFFRQTRLGRDMEEFTILKFRTMRTGTTDSAHRGSIEAQMKRDSTPDANGLFKANQDAAITDVGRWLRRTSLDELPQMINVLRGEMSLVGPRPSMPYEIESFEPHHFERFRVAPGVTGLWQVTARALTSWREAVEMDVAYVRSWSLGLDIWLLCHTPAQLVRLKTS